MASIRLIGAGDKEIKAVCLTAQELGLSSFEEGMPVSLQKRPEETYALRVKAADGSAVVEYRDIPALLRALRQLAASAEPGEEDALRNRGNPAV